MTDLSDSYAKTLKLVDEGQMEAAHTEFKKGCVQTVKKLYSEAATTYPLRFAKTDNWCKWTRALYILTLKTDKDWAKGDMAEARKLLPELRKHFYDLHKRADVRRSNDFIFEFFDLIEQPKPSLDSLKAAQNSLKEATPSRKGQAAAQDYETAKALWLKEVGPILERGELGDTEVSQLRASTKAFYETFGQQFE